MFSEYQLGSVNNLFKLMCGGFSLLTIAFLSLHFSINDMKSRDRNAFIQKNDGVTETVYQINHLERRDEVLKKFANDFFKGCFTWDGMYDSKPDPGIFSHWSQSVIPTRLNKCQFAFDPVVGRIFYKDLTEKYSSHHSFENKLSPASYVKDAVKQKREVQITVFPFDPKKISEGHWEIEVGSTRYFKIGTQLLEEPFNWKLTLKAIPPYPDPMQQSQSAFGELINAWNAQGLKIIKIERTK